MQEDRSLFIREGEGFLGNPCAAGPWSPNALAGGSILALMGHVLEDLPTVTPMSLSRITVDMFRPAPRNEPIKVETSIRREGKKLQVVDIAITAGGTEYAIARALRLRNADIDGFFDPASQPLRNEVFPQVPPPPEYAKLMPPNSGTGFIPRGIDFVRALELVDGPNTIWMRLRVPVIEGEEVRATSLAVVPMDVVNLIGFALDTRKVTAINADVSAHINRYPVGEWIAITGNTRVDSKTGHGASMGIMSDCLGVFGHTSMAQIVDSVAGK